MKRNHIWLIVIIALIVLAVCFGKPEIVPNDTVLILIDTDQDTVLLTQQPEGLYVSQEKISWKTLSVSSYRLGYQESFMEMINSSMIKVRLSDAERELYHKLYEKDLEIATMRFIKIRDGK